MFADAATDDFFRARLDHMIDLRHSLAVLASRMPWQQIEASVAHLFSRRAHTGESLPDLDLFGEAPAPVGRKSNAGRPRVPAMLRRAPGLSTAMRSPWGCLEPARALLLDCSAGSKLQQYRPRGWLQSSPHPYTLIWFCQASLP